MQGQQESRWLVNQPSKREQLASLTTEDFRARIRTILGDSEITGAPRPNPLLIRPKKAARIPKRKKRSEAIKNLVVGQFFMHYNFCRIHQALRVTPSMEAGINDPYLELG